MPNPATGNTLIVYRLLPGTAKARIEVTDYLGRSVKNYVLNHENTILEIPAGEIQNGIFTYTLVVNNAVVAAKRMVIIK